MSSVRQEKIARLIHKDLGNILQKRTNQYGGMVTVTQVRVSPDLGVAKVYVSIFPGDPKEIHEIVKADVFEIRKELAAITRHQLRKTPELIFYLDDSNDYLENIENLLKE